MHTSTKDERTWALLCHISGILTGFVGPLVIWLIKKDESAYVNDQGKEALNFQITLFIIHAAIIVVSIISCGITLPLALVVYFGSIVLMIMAAMKANEGAYYRYPMTLRLVK
jgi:uncharacterized protein